MGLKKLGKKLKKITRKVGGLAHKTLGKVLKPLSKVMAPFQKIFDRVLSVLPFGKLLRPFVSAFLGGPLGLVTCGPLAGLGAISRAASGPHGLLQVAQAVAPTPAFVDPVGRANVLRLIAYEHARRV